MPMAKQPTNRVKVSTFRLSEEEIELLDRIAEHKGREDGAKRSRTDAIRMSARHFAAFLGLLPKSKK
jgi:hypothetical protein